MDEASSLSSSSSPISKGAIGNSEAFSNVSTTIFEDQPRHHRGTNPFDRLTQAVANVPDAKLVSNEEIQHQRGNHSLQHVNSIVFLDEADGRYVLTIVPADRRVNVDALGTNLRLCPADRLVEICGYAPGTVPPLVGLNPPPTRTVICTSLPEKSTTGSQTWVYGGGGLIDVSCVLPLDFLLKQSKVTIKDISTSKRTNDARCTDDTSSRAMKPYFAIAPPSKEVARQILLQQHTGDTVPNISTTETSVVGRVTSVRRMARKLVFADLAPPATLNAPLPDPMSRPWQCPHTHQDLAIQLIAGKTLVHGLSDDEGAARVRLLRPGQLVFVQARTNTQSVDSLRNWVVNDTLDLVVYSFHILQMMESEGNQQQGTIESNDSHFKSASTLGTTSMTAAPKDVSLQLHHVYPRNESETCEAFRNEHVRLVDSPEGVMELQQAVTELLRDLATAPRRDYSNSYNVGLVGVDCEWLPNYYMESSKQPQPVLVLQICLHPLRRVYVLDLQTLLRPMLPPSAAVSQAEEAVAKVLGELWISKELVITGYQVIHDLRQLAASYPHISNLRTVHSVLELSTLAKKVMHLQKQRNARTITASLSRLCAHFLGRCLQKEEQCSNWSVRPLTQDQIEYAALDAVVSPVITEQLLEAVQARFFDRPRVGRHKEDKAFARMLESWRFVCLEGDEDQPTTRSLGAKRVVGELLWTNQNWVTGDRQPPSSILANGDSLSASYRENHRLPSQTVSISSTLFHSQMNALLATYVGRSKERCILPFLNDEVGKLDFPSRSGLIELANAFFLFVNQPSLGEKSRPRNFPNEWLEHGRILTWFMRRNQWQDGQSDLARKLMSDGSMVALFVRMGKSSFLTCGRCRVEAPVATELVKEREWNLVRLHLHLLDWAELKQSPEFQEMVQSDDVAN